MFKNITQDYRSVRAFQICVVFVATLALQRWLQFTHDAWIGFSVMMINAGFDSGTSLHRTQHRFWGAVLGLLLSYFLWFFIRVHDEIIFFVVPIVVFMAFFVMGKYYVSPTIFTVTLTALGTIYYMPANYHVSEFFFDYGRATLMALVICVFFEFFVFKKERLTHQFYFDLQRHVIRELNALFQIVAHHPLREGQYLKICMQLNSSIVIFKTFSSTMRHDYYVEEKHYKDFEDFCVLMEGAYQNIRQLFVLKAEQDFQLKEKTAHLLKRLDEISLEHYA